MPAIHLDSHYWRPGWQASEIGDWRERVTGLAAGAEWIMEGNYANVFDICMPAADTLVWLDYPRTVCMGRVLARMIWRYGRPRPELPERCTERLDYVFLRYVWDFPVKHRQVIVDDIERFGAHLRVVRIGNDRDKRRFLSTIG